MRHAAALGLKLVAYLVIFGVTMPVFGLRSIPASIVLAAVHTLLLWLSDLVVLPRFGNLVATLGDIGILVFGSAFVLGALAVMPNPFGLLLAVVAGTLFEIWFHRWLLSSALVE